MNALNEKEEEYEALKYYYKVNIDKKVIGNYIVYYKFNDGIDLDILVYDKTKDRFYYFNNQNRDRTLRRLSGGRIEDKEKEILYNLGDIVERDAIMI